MNEENSMASSADLEKTAAAAPDAVVGADAPFASPAPTVGLAVIYKQHLATQLAINFASMLQMVCHQGAT